MGKTRKSKWNHLQPVKIHEVDATDHQRDINTIKNKKAKYVAENLDDLVQITKEPTALAKAKKVTKKGEKSKIEEKMVERLAKRLKPVESTKKEEKKDQMFDLWGVPDVSLKKKPDLRKYNRVVNRAVILPTSGESYNPNHKSYEKTLTALVEGNTEKSDRTNDNNLQRRNKRKLDKLKKLNGKTSKKRMAKLGENEKKVLLEREKQLNEKKLNTLVENFDKEFESKVGELRNRAKKIKKREANIEAKNESIRKGEIRDYKLNNSKHKIPNYVQPNVLLPEELPDNLRRLKTDNRGLVRDQFDSFYRRGLIEYTRIGKSQKRSKMKLHNKHSAKQDFYVAPQ